MGIKLIKEQVKILLVDDNPADIRIIQEVFTECKLSGKLHVVEDGTDALDLFHHKGNCKNSILPDLILLDLNMPKLDGYSVLADIKSDKDLKIIPVIVMSTSSSKNDIRRAYKLHANCYITKPNDIEGYITIMKSIEEYWLNIVRLPGSE